eukprot:gene9865-10911_t
MSDLMDERIQQAVEGLIKANINFVAIDFDQTMISLHTYGRFLGKPEELAPFLRPVFLKLVPAIADKNIELAIVTFSGQVSMIRKVLEINFGELFKRFVIRGTGREEDWRVTEKALRKLPGKQGHMASAAAVLNQRGDVVITPASTLLIDDDERNVLEAIASGTPGIVFNPESPLDLLDEMVALETLLPQLGQEQEEGMVRSN